MALLINRLWLTMQHKYTQPEPEQRMLLEQLRLTLPKQPPPKITAKQVRETTAEPTTV